MLQQLNALSVYMLTHDCNLATTRGIEIRSEAASNMRPHLDLLCKVGCTFLSRLSSLQRKLPAMPMNTSKGITMASKLSRSAYRHITYY